MSHTYPGCRRGLAACLSLWSSLALVAALAAQAPPDNSKESVNSARRLNEVEAQKVEADIRLAVRESQRVSSTSPDKAVDKLKEALSQLEDTKALSEDRRTTLKSMLKDRIRVTQWASTTPKDAADLDKQAAKASQKAKDAERTAEQDQIHSLLSKIKSLQKEGKLGLASLKAGEFLSRFPDSPVAQATERTAATNNQLAANRQLQTEKEKGTGGVLRDVDRSAVPPSGDIQFPKDWKERTKNRKTKTQLTAKELAIVRGLNSTISVPFKDSRLEDVIEYLQTYIGQPIVLDPLAMETVGAKYDTPVTLKLKSVSVRTVLKKVLGDLGLTYVIKDEMILVTTPDKAKDMMVTRVYSIADLARNRFEAAMLIDLIQSTVDPQSWQANGGAATIAYHPLTRSLVIKQTAEFHGKLSGMLP